jgi:carbamoyltransferase
LTITKIRKIIWINKKEGTFESSINVQYAKYRFLIDNLSNHRFDSIAWGIQKFTEELVLDFIKETLKKYDAQDVYFSGGVFMNIKLNQIIKSEIADRNLYFTPSCGDESLAIGAAKSGYDQETNLYSQSITDLYLGTKYTDEEIAITLKELGTDEFIITDYTKGEFGVEGAVASLLSKNEIVARFKGRMEWGARALGNRSILANPSDLNAVKKINEAIKNRDFWMPFAPTILDTLADNIIFNQSPSPYMTLGFNTKPNMILKLNACVHPYDGTCRPQILTRNANPEYYQLITSFAEYSEIGAILNTSFNLHGKPIVESTADAIETLKLSDLRHLAIGNYLVSKK